MCGIHGVLNAGNQPSFLEKYMQEGFVVNAVRGMDSSGLFQIPKGYKDQKAYMHKLTVPGPMFIDNKATKQIIEDASKSALTVGHVRAATHGGVTVDNAHPFMVRGQNNKRIIGVHNGTLSSWKTKKDWQKFDVDSLWALTHIGANGIKAFEDIDGAFVFVWWDENTPGKVYMVRNTGRPLWFVLTKDQEQMMFGSESGMVSWLCERNNIPTEDTIYELDTMKLYTFDFSGKKITFTTEPIPAYKTAYMQSSNYHNPNYMSRDGDWSQRQRRRNDAQSAFENMDDGAGEATQFEWDDRLGFTRNDEGRGPSRAAASFHSEAEKVIDASKRALRDARAAIYKAEAIEERGGGRVVDTEIVGQRDDDAPASNERKALTNKAKRRAKKAAKAQQRATLHLPATTKASSLSAGIKRAMQSHSANRAATESDVQSVLKAGNDRAAAENAECFPEEILQEGWFSTGGSTQAEKDGAKQLGIYGQLHWLQGRAYEPETGELIGDIEDWTPGTGRTRYIGIMRNTTASVAQREYIGNTLRGGWVAVIGVSYMREWNGKTLIVGELTEAGVAGMKKRQVA